MSLTSVLSAAFSCIGRDIKSLIASIPTKTSQLTNDAQFQTAQQVASSITSAVPTKTSQLTNDAQFQTAQQVATLQSLIYAALL